jgi:ABC-type cobalamin/Fe3+-siderophores transport system ATPase subunit
MNFPEDSVTRLTKVRHLATPELFALLAWHTKTTSGSPDQSSDLEDIIPIELRDVAFRYDGQDEPTFVSVTATLHQGTFIGVVGAASTGKNTLLQLIGQVLVPPEGSVMCPGHLRILHVSHEVLLLKSSVADNLFFGIRPSGGHARDLTKAQLERGWAILERLGAPEQLMQYAKNLDGGEEETMSLSRSDRKLVHIARALIYNPELMVVHCPDSFLDLDRQGKVLAMLKKFVVERGVEMPEKTRTRRRLRTCVFSTGDAHHLKDADQILETRDQTVYSIDLPNVLARMQKWRENATAEKSTRRFQQPRVNVGA